MFFTVWQKGKNQVVAGNTAKVGNSRSIVQFGNGSDFPSFENLECLTAIDFQKVKTRRQAFDRKEMSTTKSADNQAIQIV